MKKIFAAAAIAAAFVATPVLAQSYIGFGVGSAKISGADGTIPAGVTMSGGNTSKTSVKVYGGFQFTPNWGVEAQYSDLGNRNLTFAPAGSGTGSLKASQFSIAGTGTLPLAANFSLLGKLGVSANRGKIDSTNFGSSSFNRTELMAGVGVAYNITPKLAVRLEYEDFGKFSNSGGFSGGSIRANNYSLGVQYGF